MNAHSAVRLPLPYRGHTQSWTRQQAIAEAIERLTERLWHPSAATQTLAAARADIVALLAEVEEAIDA